MTAPDHAPAGDEGQDATVHQIHLRLISRYEKAAQAGRLAARDAYSGAGPEMLQIARAEVTVAPGTLNIERRGRMRGMQAALDELIETKTMGAAEHG